MNLKGLFGIFFLLKIVNLLRKYEVLSFDSENNADLYNAIIVHCFVFDFFFFLCL